MSKYTLIIKKDARKYRTPLFETNNNTIGLEMQQKEVKICGGVGRGSGGRLQQAFFGAAAGLPGKSPPPETTIS